jgi:hypothetical protein
MVIDTARTVNRVARQAIYVVTRFRAGAHLNGSSRRFKFGPGGGGLGRSVICFEGKGSGVSNVRYSYTIGVDESIMLFTKLDGAFCFPSTSVRWKEYVDDTATDCPALSNRFSFLSMVESSMSKGILEWLGSAVVLVR